MRGHFSRALVEPRSVFRVAFAADHEHLRPASLLATQNLPLKEALQHMDGEGPFGDDPYRWFQKASREFTLQCICTGSTQTERPEREHVKTLKADSKLKELLSSKQSVVFLDAYAALAPRQKAKEYCLSKIVQAELVEMLRQAKSKEQAVVFMVGGGDPHKLAEKVYLQPCFTAYGLRCGYLRWRESPTKPWARETLAYDNRFFVGLQLP